MLIAHIASTQSRLLMVGAFSIKCLTLQSLDRIKHPATPMQITTAKILGLVIVLAYAVLLIVNQSAETAYKGCAFLLLPLVLIWFPEELGSMTGYFLKGSYVNAESPPILLSIMGWFLLVGVPVLLYFLS